jgi:hypothetical protein
MPNAKLAANIMEQAQYIRLIRIQPGTFSRYFFGTMRRNTAMISPGAGVASFCFFQ